MPKSGILYVANMSFKAIRENKILMKISEFTVYSILDAVIGCPDRMPNSVYTHQGAA